MAVLGLVLLVGVLVKLLNPDPEIARARRAAHEAPSEYVPRSYQIAVGHVTVLHEHSVRYRIVITPAMRDPTVSGSFEATGGTGNDIVGVLADENGYENWINGHQAQVYWATQGQQTVGKFQVRLPPGIYYLAFSNRFSSFTDKDLSLAARLDYLAPVK